MTGNDQITAIVDQLAAGHRVLLFSQFTSMLALVKGGQHVVLFRDCYRMTLEFVTDVLARFGVAHTLLAAGDLDALPQALRPETRLVLSESPTNPYLACVDLERLSAACKPHRTIKSMIDATFATPVSAAIRPCAATDRPPVSLPRAGRSCTSAGSSLSSHSSNESRNECTMIAMATIRLKLTMMAARLIVETPALPCSWAMAMSSIARPLRFALPVTHRIRVGISNTAPASNAAIAA